MLRVIPVASHETDVVLIHAPYPGKLMFDAHPTSMLHAIAPFVENLSDWKVGYLDPGTPSDEFYECVRQISKHARAVCISTATAAIEEAAKIAAVAREGGGDSVLIVGGGPHEDDCDIPMATRISEIDVSIGGDAEFVLDALLNGFLCQGKTPKSFCRDELPSIPTKARGKGRICCKWWAETTGTFGKKKLNLDDVPHRPIIEKPVHFSVFDAPTTLPVMVSRGCSYGQCSFCAEGGGSDQQVQGNFDWLRALMEMNPESAVYFQDSIFPRTKVVQRELLPLLRESGSQWGGQVFLKMLSKSYVEELAAHGCTYLYTGIESAEPEILSAIGKGALSRELMLERFAWINDAGIKLGVSLMFGAMGEGGRLLETPESVDCTMGLIDQANAASISFAGIYPNVETVLPGTALARTLERAGIELDFYSMPTFEPFRVLEDGGVGHNFATIDRHDHEEKTIQAIVAAATQSRRSCATIDSLNLQ